MLGNFFFICSAALGNLFLIHEISKNTPLCGLPLPSLISRTIHRATWSRVRSSGGRLALRSPCVYFHPSSSLSAVWLRYSSGISSNINRLCSLLSKIPPSPLTPSVTKIPRTLGGQTIPVG